MNITFFTKGNKNVASSRYRAYEIANELKNYNYKVDIYSQLENYPIYSIKRLSQFIRLIFFFMQRNKEDILFLQRAFLPVEFIFIWIIFKKIKKYTVIFDYDDASYIHWPRSYSLSIRYADIVFAGSNSLLKHAKKLNVNSYLIPTSVPIKNYIPKKNYNNKKTNIGWIGNGPSHYQNLKILKPVFKQLIKDQQHFKFTLIGALNDRRIYDLFNIDSMEVKMIDTLDWKNTKSVSKHINKFDIGLMPLEDAEFQRGKCAFKAIEYMACRVPTIASRVGENKTLIKDGANGYLAQDTNEWVKKISILMNSVEERKKFGAKGRETIIKSYSTKSAVSKIIKILNQHEK